MWTWNCWNAVLSVRYTHLFGCSIFCGLYFMIAVDGKNVNKHATSWFSYKISFLKICGLIFVVIHLTTLLFSFAPFFYFITYVHLGKFNLSWILNRKKITCLHLSIVTYKFQLKIYHDRKAGYNFVFSYYYRIRIHVCLIRRVCIMVLAMHDTKCIFSIMWAKWTTLFSLLELVMRGFCWQYWSNDISSDCQLVIWTVMSLCLRFPKWLWWVDVFVPWRVLRFISLKRSRTQI